MSLFENQEELAQLTAIKFPPFVIAVNWYEGKWVIHVEAVEQVCSLGVKTKLISRGDNHQEWPYKLICNPLPNVEVFTLLTKEATIELKSKMEILA